MSEVVRVPWNDRGFLIYGPEPIVCTYGSTIRVTESSAAFDDYMWLRLLGFNAPPDPMDSPLATPGPYEAAAHLNRAMVVELVARLQAWLDDHPHEGDDG